MSVAQAEAELTRVAGSRLDPECVETFLRLLRSGKVSVKPGADGVQNVAGLAAAAEPSDALLR